MKLSLFDHLKNLTINKSEFDPHNDEQAKSYTPYMINRFISMTDVLLPVVNQINRFDLPKSVHYRYFKTLLPKRKFFFNYIKKKKDVDLDEKKLLCKYFECGLREIENIITVLPEDQIKDILNKYRTVK